MSSDTQDSEGPQNEAVLDTDALSDAEIDALIGEDEDITEEELVGPKEPVKRPIQKEREGLIEWSPARGQIIRIGQSKNRLLDKLCSKNVRVSFIFTKFGTKMACLNMTAKNAREALRTIENGKDPSV